MKKVNLMSWLAALLIAAGSVPMLALEQLYAAPAQQAQAVQTVNINKADQAELELVRGIGPALAERILNYRKANGSFQKVEDLVKVPGIGPAKLEKIKAQITV